MADAALAIAGLSKSFGAAEVLRGLDLRCAPGAVHVLMGRNGSGKSTLLACISGRLQPDAGTIALNAHILPAERAWKRARRGLAWTFQDGSPDLRVSVSEVLRVAAARSAGASGAAEELLAAIEPFRDRAWCDLSFGQRKLAALAAALSLRPVVALLDEPVAGLSPPLAALVAEAVRAAARGGAAVLMVEHQRDFILKVADELSVLANGEIVLTGSPRETLADPRLMGALS